MNILLTFAGNRDPFNPEIVKGIFSDGPVLTLLAERSFDAVHIFTTPNTLPNARQLQLEMGKRAGDIHTHIHLFDIPDPTDYETLFLHMSGCCRDILAEYQDRQPAYCIATASGTPQMQTVWFLLAQSGLVPAALHAIIMIARRHPMANVLIRDIPDEVINELKRRAKAHNRPLQRALRRILEETARLPYEDIVQRATEIRLKLAGKNLSFSDSAESIREDRGR